MFHILIYFRTFFQLLSQLTTVKLFPDHGTRPSNCGIHWLNVNTPFKKMDTAIGFHAFVSHQTKSIQLLSVLVGIAPSRSGIWPTANWSWTIMDTMDIWTQSLSLQTVHCAHQEERIAKLCCGIWMTANICTLWTTMTSSTLCASHLTVTGCVLLTVHPSRFGIWPARKWSKNWNQESHHKTQRPIHHNACLWLGLLMVKLCSLDTPTTRSVSGKCLSPLVK